MLNNAYRFLLKVRLSLVFLLSGIFLFPLVAQDQDFRVQSIEFNQDGKLVLEYPSTAGSYYLLKRGSTVDILDSPVAAQLGAAGMGQLEDTVLPGTPKTFYEVQKISVNEPLDSDGDGIDDVYELEHPEFLSPFNPADAALDFDSDTLSNLKEYQDGTDPASPPFDAAKITRVTPGNGEEMVNVTRTAVVYFDRELDPETIDTDSLFIQMNNAPVEGSVEVSSTKKFATFFPAQPFPTSSQLKVVVNGDLIKDLDGNPIDADGNGIPGGIRQSAFRTLSATRITGTTVWGNVKDSFSGLPIEGVTIYVNAFPDASATTDSEGRFELTDMPAPEFYVHIVGGTAENVPTGFQYPNLGKPVNSIPGRTTQLNKNGEPFDIFLPLMSLNDAQELSSTEVTEVGMGSEGKQTLTSLFPQIDSAVWDRICVEISPGSARDDLGNTFSQATLVPVPPDRIPEPLPPELGMPLVISVQVFQATRFDVPAPVTFPNLPDPVTGKVLLPGAKTGLWSYDHDAGHWTLQGTMTVSEDGLFQVSDPGVGIRAPGWHGTNPANPGEDGGSDDEGDNCTTKRRLYQSSAVQCVAGAVIGLIELAPGIGCAVSLGGAATGAAVDCNIDPANCSTTVAKSSLGGILGCIPGAGLAVTGLICVTTVTSSWVDYKSCKSSSSKNTNGNAERDLQSVDELDIDTVFEDQIDLIEKARSLYETVAGDPEWWAVPVEELGTLKEFLTAFEAAMELESAGAVQIAVEETSALLARERPSNITNAHINALIERFNRFSSGGMTAEEQSAIVNSATEFKEKAEYLEAIGWETTNEGFTQGLSILSAESDAEVTRVKATSSYYKLTNMSSGLVRRGRLNFQGHFENILLLPNTYYSVEYVDPDTLGVGIAVFQTPDPTITVEIPRVHLSQSVDQDFDGDGLTDEIEEILGTLRAVADSDEDGVSDGEELQQGTNPLDGIFQPLGELASVPLSGSARAIALDGNNAYVATYEHGLAIVDISNPLAPIITSELELTGLNEKVIVSDTAQVAAVASYPDYIEENNQWALHFVDVSNPQEPVLLKTLEIPVKTMIHKDGIFYISAGWPVANQILMFDSTTLDQIGGVQAYDDVTGMVIYKNKLFSASGQTLEVFDLNDPGFPRIKIKELPSGPAFPGGRQLHVEQDVLYAGTFGGFSVWDISDPSNPQTIASPSGTQAIQKFASTGSGTLLTLSGSVFTTVKIHKIDDPANITEITPTTVIQGFFQDFQLRNSLLYITKDEDGIGITNYLEIDRNETAPTITLDLEHLDIDPGTAGIQVVEGSRIFIEPLIFDDIQTRVSRLFLNGQLIEFNQRGHTVFSPYLPLISEGGSEITIQVNATDTGTNTGNSNIVTLELVPDTSAPAFFSTAPTAGGIALGTGTIQILLDEAIDPTSINLNQIMLSRTTGGAINIIDITFSNPQLMVLWLENPLTSDAYRLTINNGAFTDVKGNALAGSLDISFESLPIDPATAVWTSDLDGSFFDPANWNFGLVPRENQNVYIGRPTSNPLVTFDDAINLSVVTIHEPFIIDPGNAFINVVNDWVSTSAGTLKSGNLQLQADALFSGPITFEGGGMRAYSMTEFTSDFNVISGSIVLVSENADLLITGAITPGDLSIENKNGTTLEIPWITNMGGTNPALTLTATGSGSILRLPNLVSLTPPVAGGTSSMKLQAFAGGVLDLPQFQTIEPGRIEINSNGEGSSLLVPNLTSMIGPASGAHSKIIVNNSGSITAGPITTLELTDVDVNSTSTFSFESLTSLSNSVLRITGSAASLSNLVSAENISLFAFSGAVIEIPNITTLNLANNEFRADRADSVVRLPNLLEITGSPASGSPINFWSQRGGRVELPALTSLSGYGQVKSTDENSVTDMTALSQVTGTETRNIQFTATTGGTVQLSSPNMIRGDLFTTTTGTISGNMITTATGSLVRGPGTLSSNLSNQSIIKLDKDTGPVVIAGNLILDTDSLIEVTIGMGTNKTGSGKLQVTGATTLGGTLKIIQSGSYSPQAGDQFEIVTFGSKTLDFAQVDGLALKNGLTGQLEITDTSVTLKVVAP